jgi:hypothetical protein
MSSYISQEKPCLLVLDHPVAWLGSDQGNYPIFQIYVKKKGLFSRLELQSITWVRPQVEASPGHSARWKEEMID